MVQFLEKEHKNFEKILYKSMAFENCANFLKATNMLIGRNPKNDFRVKHPFINQEFHVMISELDKCAERKQSFSFFNVKELVPSVHIQARPEIPYLWTLVLQPFRKMAQEFTAVHKDIFNMKTTRRRIKERIQRKLFTQDWFAKTGLVELEFRRWNFIKSIKGMDELEEELEDETYSENSQISHSFSEFYITQEDREILRLLQTSKRVMERNIRQDRYCEIRAQRTRTFHTRF